jgi:hypothetical protein
VSTRAIRTSIDQGTCDVCGRTLLRGERAEIYLGGGSRHSVCELCTSRALHDGWVREGEMPDLGPAQRPARRRSLLGRLRGRGGEDRVGRDTEFEAEFADESGWEDEDVVVGPPEADWAPAAGEPEPDAGFERPVRSARAGLEGEPASRRSRRSRRPRPAEAEPEPAGENGDRPNGRLGGLIGRERRHVRAVPSSAEHRISSAIRLFNESEHPRTVAGIARSLGLPDVAVRPTEATGSVVAVVVSWELCWYRYEVDLGDEYPAVRLAAQGYELSELSELERAANAVCDDRGKLALAG